MFVAVFAPLLVLASAGPATTVSDLAKQAFLHFDAARSGIYDFIETKNEAKLDALNIYDNSKSFSIYTCFKEVQKESAPTNAKECTDLYMQEFGKGAFKRGILKFLKQEKFTVGYTPFTGPEQSGVGLTSALRSAPLFLIVDEKKTWYCQLTIQYSLPKVDNVVVDLRCN